MRALRKQLRHECRNEGLFVPFAHNSRCIITGQSGTGEFRCREAFLRGRIFTFTIEPVGKTDFFDAREWLPCDERHGRGSDRESSDRRHNTRLTQITGRESQDAADRYKFQLF
jgi:hypothetical protein